ncbi:MAG TPA: DNA primase small subunit domain-containing protein [Candidatus Omnitrophota bacterium]|nr:DNA primase small subunit domain-containing protein [Candidatus Omnitrophota bacterium]
MNEPASSKEERIRKITHLYYSRPEIQNALFEFSKDRETVPRYFEGFGKRPDALQYPNDVFELVKKGATSFHCSEELWKDPLKVETGMNEKQLNELRKGWDLLIDIDSKYLDYSKVACQVIINFLNFYGIKNIGIKFSGSKGFHLIVPWKSLPKEINGMKTSDMFPEWARIIVQYIHERIEKQLIEKISEFERPNKYVRDFRVSEDVAPDLILVSPRHLFRMPYSLHEKTALASIVLSVDEIKNFQMTDANPIKIKIRKFLPDSKEGEASRLFIEALDWHKAKSGQQKTSRQNFEEFKPVKFEKLSDESFPPSIKKILEGIRDGKKRALFILINFFRFISMDRAEIEKRIFDWNKKNTPPLLEGYIKNQLSWAYKKKPVLPPNYDKDYYKGIGIIPTPEEIRSKNPVGYITRKNYKQDIKVQKNKDNFKNLK